MVLALWLGPMSSTELLCQGCSPGQNESKKEEWHFIDNYKGDKNLLSFLCSSDVRCGEQKVCTLSGLCWRARSPSFTDLSPLRALIPKGVVTALLWESHCQCLVSANCWKAVSLFRQGRGGSHLWKILLAASSSFHSHPQFPSHSAQQNDVQLPGLFSEIMCFIPFLGTACVPVFSEMVIARCMMNARNTEKIVEIPAWSKGIAGGRVSWWLRNLPVEPGHFQLLHHSAVKLEKLDLKLD